MRTAFIIFAIFVAVVLLVRFAAPAATPKLYAKAERITNNALLANIRALSKRCAVTEYGQGISYSMIKIRSVLSACKKRVNSGVADDWQRVLNDGSNTILHAFVDGKSAARYSAYCGHVGKYPRVFLFSERLIRDSGCEITHRSLFDAISAFEENAEFTLSERKILCGMIKLCLIWYLHSVTENAVKRCEEYDKGATDGLNGSVNLDYLNSDDYICGLVHACADKDGAAVNRLLEHNGVDICSADSRRRKRLAQVYLTVNSVLRSLSVIEACEKEVYTPQKHSGERGRRYVKVFNILFPILLAVYAVFTCIFASPNYVALFSVAAIITYAVMRIPVLLYSPSSSVDIFSTIEALFCKPKNGQKIESDSSNRLLLTEAAYFGSEPEYIQTVIDGAGIRLCCDNRGGITVKSNETSDCIYVGISSDGVDIELSECDGVIERHRAVYRACKGDLELCAEAVVPIDGNVCIVRLTVINRSDCDKTVNLIGAVVRNKPKSQKCYTQNIRGGSMAICDNGFALSLNDGNYGGDLCAFCADGTLKHGNVDAPALIGTTTLTVKRFARAVSYMTVVYASRTQAENMFQYVSDELYFERATESAAAYSNVHLTDKPVEMPCIVYSDRKLDKPAAFPPPVLNKSNYDFIMPFGGISDGNMVIEDRYGYKPINNTLSGGNLCVELNQFGIQSISVGKKSFTVQVDKYTQRQRAFVVIGENGVMWSPTVTYRGRIGQARAVYGSGYTAYGCAYNGMVCEQKVFTAIGLPAAFFDIKVYNKTDVERKLDIMFSAVCDSDINIEVGDNGVTASAGKCKLLLCAVGERAEYTAYKEGYFVYGKIDRTSGFRAGGSTPAPTASVCRTVEANDCARIVFCLVDEAYYKKLQSVSEVDKLLDGVKRFYGRLGRILPATDDRVLNVSYSQSLYSAYSAFVAHKRMTLYDECFVLNAAKYVDSTAVKHRIFGILCCQNQSWLLGADYYDCLQVVRCIIEFVEYTHDEKFWNEVLPYAPLRIHGERMVIKDTVINHILRAVKYLIYTSMQPLPSVVKSVWQYNNFLYVLKYFENKLKLSDDLYEQYKRCYKQTSELYMHTVKRLTANNLFEFKSVAEAYMCARLLFDLDLNEQAYNIIKYNNPINRCLHYGDRSEYADIDYFSDPVAAAVYFTTVTEKLFGVKFRGKTLKICPHIAKNTPSLSFDILSKSKDVRVTVDGSELCGNWRMRVNKINYPADSVEIRNLSDDIVFYRDGNE
ncbi:MAG: hypothetical protein K2K13_00690 [Clostridiales bacterium]|nr:hypothetical protein [Clostridiales bacterium]